MLNRQPVFRRFRKKAEFSRFKQCIGNVMIFRLMFESYLRAVFFRVSLPEDYWLKCGHPMPIAKAAKWRVREEKERVISHSMSFTRSTLYMIPLKTSFTYAFLSVVVFGVSGLGLRISAVACLFRSPRLGKSVE